MKISTSGGFGQPVNNPYDRNADLEENEKHKDFNRENRLETYLPTGERFTGDGEFEAERVYRVRADEQDEWVIWKSGILTNFDKKHLCWEEVYIVKLTGEAKPLSQKHSGR